MSFKENLKAELEYNGLQIKELAVQCGISKNTLANYLTGHNSLPTADNAVRIAQALNVSVEYLITGKNTNNKLMISEFSSKYRTIIDGLQILDDTDLHAVESLVQSLKERYKPLL